MFSPVILYSVTCGGTKGGAWLPGGGGGGGGGLVTWGAVGVGLGHVA